MAVIVQNVVLWIVPPCSSVGGYQRFRGTCCLQLQSGSEYGDVFRFRLSGILLCSYIYTLHCYYTDLTLKTEAATSSETPIYSS
jgi:hypothetical protein